MKHLLMALLVLFMFQFTTAGEFQYVGLKKCKTCHKSKKIGDQTGIWMAGPHAGALETLKNEESKEIAKKMGIADPTTDAKCLKCHVTAYEAPEAAKAKTLTLEEGVSCEACHGPGSEYKSMKVMKGLAAGTVKPEDVGLVTDMEKQCLTCHNEESPTYKKFVFAEMVKKIAHPVPK